MRKIKKKYEKMKITSLFFILFSLTIAVNAQYLEKEVKSSSSEINSILQDKINYLFMDKYDYLWIGSSKGIIKHHGESWEYYWGNYYQFKGGKPVLKKGNVPLKDNHINYILQIGKYIYFLTDKGLLKFDYRFFNFKYFDSSQICNYLQVGYYLKTQQKILIGTWGNNLCFFNLETGSFTKNTDFNLDGYHFITGVIEYKNSWWVSCLKDGIFEYNHKARRCFHYTTSTSALPVNRVKKLTRFKNFIFIATTQGLIKLDSDNFFWKIFDKNNSLLKSNNITFLYKDSSKLLIGTTKGLYKYQDNFIDPFPDTESLLKNKWITAICKDGKKGFFIATKSNGLYHLSWGK